MLDYADYYDVDFKKPMDSPKVLSMKNKLDLCAEITDIDRQVREIERMPYKETENECPGPEIQISSRINSKYNPIIPTTRKTYGLTQ